MQTIERYGLSARLTVHTAAVLYLVFAMFYFGASAQTVTFEQRVIENHQRIDGQRDLREQPATAAGHHGWSGIDSARNRDPHGGRRAPATPLIDARLGLPMLRPPRCCRRVFRARSFTPASIRSR